MCSANDDVNTSNVLFLDGHNEDVFFRDYAVAHKEFSELGFSPVREGNVKKSTILLQSGGTQLLI